MKNNISKQRARRLFIERLDDRLTLAGDLTDTLCDASLMSDRIALAAASGSMQEAPTTSLNASEPIVRWDVSGDGQVSAIDALLVINFINQNGAQDLVGASPETIRLDVSGDRFISAKDALLVINHLNTLSPLPPGAGDGELFAYEPFDYLTGSQASTSLEFQEGGLGFSGPWLEDIFSRDLPGLAEVGVGQLPAGGLRSAGGHAVISRTAWRPLDAVLGTPGTTLWLSMVMGGFPGSLGPEPESVGGILIGGLLVGDTGQSANYGLSAGVGYSVPAPSATSEVPVASAAVLVVRMQFAAGLDTFDLFVNPSPGASETAPADATLQFEWGDPDTALVSLVSLGAIAPQYTMDEIRLGSSLAAVTPAA